MIIWVGEVGTSEDGAGVGFKVGVREFGAVVGELGFAVVAKEGIVEMGLEVGGNATGVCDGAIELGLELVGVDVGVMLT